MSGDNPSTATHGAPPPPDGDTIPAPHGRAQGDRPRSDAPLSDLLTRLIDDISTLFRQEVELAKTELKREFTGVAKASGMLVAGAVLGFVALLLLAWAAAWGLAAVVPTGLAFLIVAVVVAAIAAAVVAAGRKRIKEVDLTPHSTLDSLKRDQQTISERTPR